MENESEEKKVDYDVVIRRLDQGEAISDLLASASADITSRTITEVGLILNSIFRGIRKDLAL